MTLCAGVLALNIKAARPKLALIVAPLRGSTLTMESAGFRGIRRKGANKSKS
jgi:hypothetical protein